jgi:hypothetical protein
MLCWDFPVARGLYCVTDGSLDVSDAFIDEEKGRHGLGYYEPATAAVLQETLI